MLRWFMVVGVLAVAGCSTLGMAPPTASVIILEPDLETGPAPAVPEAEDDAAIKDRVSEEPAAPTDTLTEAEADAPSRESIFSSIDAQAQERSVGPEDGGILTEQSVSPSECDTILSENDRMVLERERVFVLFDLFRDRKCGRLSSEQ